MNPRELYDSAIAAGLEMRECPSHAGYAVSKDGMVRLKKGGLTRGSPNKMGYLKVGIRINGGSRPVLVHRMVAEAFIGPQPKGMRLVRHLDGDKTNNDVSNLAYGSDKDNIADAQKHGTMRCRSTKDGKFSCSDCKLALDASCFYPYQDRRNGVTRLLQRCKECEKSRARNSRTLAKEKNDAVQGQEVGK